MQTTRRDFLKIAASVAGLGIMMPLSACGTPSSATTATDGGKVQVEYWHTNPQSRGGDTVEAQIEAFNAQSSDVEVVARYNDGYDGLMKNLQADAAANKMPDLVQVSYSNIEYFPSTFAFTPADQVAQLAGKGDFISSEFPDNIIKLGTDSKGEVVGFPYAVSDPIFYYNADIFAEVGIDKAPETWQEVRADAQVIMDKTGKQPFHLQESDTWALQAYLACNGGDMLKWEGRTAQATLSDDANVTAMEFYYEMVRDKLAIHISTDEALKAFNAGDLAMIATSCANLAGIEKAAQFTVATSKWPVFEGQQRRVPAGGCVLAVTSADDAKRKAVMEFVEFLYQADNIVDWVKGTGYVAHTKTAQESDAMKRLLEDDPLRAAAASQVDDIIPWAAWPGDSAQQAQQTISDMRDQVLSGSKDAQTALSDANDKINGLIK